MNFLKELHTFIREDKGNDLSILPSDIIAELQYKIRKGSQDVKQKWANALELVHKAYEVVGVQRPVPEMTGAWKQYESMIQYAVERLAKDRGMDADWRMSSSTFRESLETKQQYKITIDLVDPQVLIVETVSEKELIEHIRSTIPNDLEMKVIKHNSETHLKFSSFGICKKQTVKIEKIR